MIPLTVVIPLYNKKNEICSAIESVLFQSTLPAEIIVINDGSTDGSDDVVRANFAGKVRLITTENRGVSIARNTGIELSSTQYVCLLDADDSWDKQYLTEICRLIQAYPDAAFYATRRSFLSGEKKARIAKIGLSDTYFGTVANFPEVYSQGSGLISSSSVCLRREFFLKGAIFPEGEKRGEDIACWLEYSTRGKLAFSAKPLSRVNLAASNRSSSLSSIVPAQYKWYFKNISRLRKLDNFRSYRYFIYKNAAHYTLAMIAILDKDSAKLVSEYFKFNNDKFYWVLIVIGISPPFLLRRLSYLQKLVMQMIYRLN